MSDFDNHLDNYGDPGPIVAASARAKRIPTEAGDPNSLGGGFVAKYGIEAYKREYNAGWAAAGRTSDSAKYNNGNYTWAWEDGYLDRAAGREKWHLLACERHDNLPGGCGAA